MARAAKSIVGEDDTGSTVCHRARKNCGRQNGGQDRRAQAFAGFTEKLYGAGNAVVLVRTAAEFRAVHQSMKLR